MEKPLQGIRVLDLSHAVAGPYAARMMADLGADVVKLESPRGDSTRLFGEQRNGTSGFFAQYNAGKRNISLDLRTPEAVETARSLASRADVLIENFRPGVLARLGLGYDRLSSEHPGLIMLSISGFGRSGDEASRAVYAPIIHAEAGLVARQAEHSGGRVTDLTTSVADYTAGLHGAIAVLAALTMRTRTGQGQRVDINLMDAMLATDDHAHFVLDDAPVTVLGGEVWDAPGGSLMLGSVFRNTWNQLKRTFDLDDPASPNMNLAEKISVRRTAVGAWILKHGSRDALIANLEAANIAWAEIRSVESAFSPQRLSDRGMVGEIADGAGGTRRVIQSPYRFSSADSGVAGPAVRRGEHNEAVLADWLTLGSDEVEHLVSSGALSRDPAAYA
ncbi:CoA transferase [Rhodococcus sp. USK13]|uniref:CaiB/BaiF CoA transferase family protein n=1 Tax=Rhodococcus sp. USK13 TaxID=2806442 RepID=UPI001BCE0322|nr:CoA transferase [Rhodococcus sp. USK13]